MTSPYNLQLSLAVILAVIVVHVFIRRARARSIEHLPGPPSGSWLVGNLPDLFRPQEAADAEFAWTQKFGSSMRIKGAFGIDILLTADPKAIQYILNTGGYNFPKTQQSMAIANLISGKGLVGVQGTEHARQRKIMNPAFSHGALQVFLPLFQRTTQKTVAKWKDIVSQSGSASSVLDVLPWLSRTALDAMGEAGFDYDFGALDEVKNPLADVYRNLGVDLFFNRSDLTFAFEALWGYIPLRLVTLIKNLPTKQLKRIKGYRKVAGQVAKSIMDTQIKTHAAGKEGGKDIMSILVRANLSEDPKTKLSEEQILSQLTTLMLAGHSTTAVTVIWALYELSRDPKFQNKIREEIKIKRCDAAQRGDSELSVADLDSMKNLVSLMKETLRYHPIVPLMVRDAGRDDIIPLAAPQVTKTDETVTSIPVRKGQLLMLSIAAYNRLKSVWGPDADVWNPERFLDGVEKNQKTGLGVTSNLATFSSGLRSCIGWRFALIEMQAILIELLDNFEFSPPPGNIEVFRRFAGLMTPMVKGSAASATLPLTVTPLR